MFTHNLGLKVLSLVLAAALWLFVVAEKETEIGAAVPVEVKNLPRGLAIVNRTPSRVDVRLAGPRIALLKMRAVPPLLLLDLQGAREGITGFPGLEKDIPLPAGVRVIRITPDTIEVRLAKAGPTGK
jgi:hypothetical protein